jgi:hypothetical protein
VASTFPQITNSFFQDFIEKEKISWWIDIEIYLNRYSSKYKGFSLLFFYFGKSEIYMNLYNFVDNKI